MSSRGVIQRPEKRRESSLTMAEKRKRFRDLIQRQIAELRRISPGLTMNEAAARAVEMVQGKTINIPCHAPQSMMSPTKEVETSKAPPESLPRGSELQYITLADLEALVDECQSSKNYLPLVRKVGQVFSNAESLNASFLKKGSYADGGSLSHQDDLTVDRQSARKAFELLSSLNRENVQSSLVNAMLMLADGIDMEVRYRRPSINAPNYLNQFVIWLENPEIQSPEYLDLAFPKLCHVMTALPEQHQKRLISYWSLCDSDYLRYLLGSFQQLITFRLLSGNFSGRGSRLVNNEQAVCDAVACLSYIHLASLLGGKKRQSDSALHVSMATEKVDDSEVAMSAASAAGATAATAGSPGLPPSDEEDDDEVLSLPFAFFGLQQMRRKKKGGGAGGSRGGVDQLDALFGVHFWEIQHPLVGSEEFVNEVLNEVISVEQDYAIKTSQGGGFSFFNYPFVLKPNVKVQGLFLDNRIQMRDEGRLTVFNMLQSGIRDTPYLKLRICRDEIVRDALVQLELMAQESPQELKKQLFIEFEGEQGFDEGGVQKEFFQLVIEELFSPKYAMFSAVEESRKCWFNPTSFENDSEYMLIGIMLGLAIYNHVILDLHFPMAVYRKLMGYHATFEDLREFHPVLSASLTNMLEFEGDVEESFMCNFTMNYSDVFGSLLTFDLKENGSQIPVTNENRQEYVQLYIDFVLNKMIEKQFNAFKRGFNMVVDEYPLKLWFRPDELELLICGSEDLDFVALEGSTLYDGGFTKDSPVIKWFWEVVHDFSEEQKKKLLSFATGSDRVPLGGLSQLKFIIAKNGTDSERLPTAHTCFNVLLLCEYSSKDKLKERLLKAITHAKGFGMI